MQKKTKESFKKSEREIGRFGFIERATLLFCEQGVVGEDCDLMVKKVNEWYVLQGRVDSHETKRKLFSLVPKVDGARWIVDRVRVGRSIRGTA